MTVTLWMPTPPALSLVVPVTPGAGKVSPCATVKMLPLIGLDSVTAGLVVSLMGAACTEALNSEVAPRTLPRVALVAVARIEWYRASLRAGRTLGLGHWW